MIFCLVRFPVYPLTTLWRARRMTIANCWCRITTSTSTRISWCTMLPPLATSKFPQDPFLESIFFLSLFCLPLCLMGIAPHCQILIIFFFLLGLDLKMMMTPIHLKGGNAEASFSAKERYANFPSPDSHTPQFTQLPQPWIPQFVRLDLIHPDPQFHSHLPRPRIPQKIQTFFFFKIQNPAG